MPSAATRYKQEHSFSLYLKALMSQCIVRLAPAYPQQAKISPSKLSGLSFSLPLRSLHCESGPLFLYECFQSLWHGMDDLLACGRLAAPKCQFKQRQMHIAAPKRKDRRTLLLITVYVEIGCLLLSLVLVKITKGGV